MKLSKNTDTEVGEVQGNSSIETATGEQVVNIIADDHDKAIVAVQNNLATARDKLKQEIIASGEAQRISDKLAVDNPQSIVEFGRPVAEEMSKVADEVLRRTTQSSLSDTGKMMQALSKVMAKIDIDEIKETPDNGFFDKLFKTAQKKLEQFTAKYNSVGKEIEKICTELRTYEAQIKQSNGELELMYDNGVQSYQTLMKYVIAGEMAMVELNNYIETVNAQAQTDPTAQLTLNNLNQAKQLLEQRVQDLRLAESVALQSLPMVKAIEFGNLNLSRKINSAFIITLPVFKNAIAQAVFIKQQMLQAKSMAALDAATNELLIKNSRNIADSMRTTASLSGKSSIDIATIEESWKNIMDGIRETNSITAELSKQRDSDKVRLEQINQQYLSQVN